MRPRNVVVIGAGGHAVSLTETVRACGREIEGYVDAFRESGQLMGRPLLNEMPSNLWHGEFDFLVAIGDNHARMQVTRDLLGRTSPEHLPAFVHPSSSIAQSAHIAPATVVLQGAVVCTEALIDEGCIVNTASIVEHESRLKAYASLAPSACIGGRTCIGERSFIGMGAVVKHGIKVGDDTVVGAQSYVHFDLPNQVVAFGVPARIQRERTSSDSYLG